ncbi:MAG: hypothetical protein WC998_00510 [Candidatus Paceibacterota bacterium]|jgi:hypothetical protein
MYRNNPLWKQTIDPRKLRKFSQAWLVKYQILKELNKLGSGKTTSVSVGSVASTSSDNALSETLWSPFDDAIANGNLGWLEGYAIPINVVMGGGKAVATSSFYFDVSTAKLQVGKAAALVGSIGLCTSAAGEIILTAPAALAAAHTYTWPDTLPAADAGYFLSGTMAGGLSWVLGSSTCLWKVSGGALKPTVDGTPVTLKASETLGLSEAAASTQKVFFSQTGDANYRCAIDCAGKITWGDGANPVDATLERIDATTLGTNCKLQVTRDAANKNIITGSVVGDATPRIMIEVNSTMYLGGDGAGGYDGCISCASDILDLEADTINIDGLTVLEASTTDKALSFDAGSTYNRLEILGTGSMFWGAGSTDVDVNLYRGAANKLYLANGDTLRFLSGIVELSGISGVVSPIAGVMQVYYNTDRLYAIEPSGEIHDLTVAERQNFQIAVGNREAGTTDVLVSVDTEAANGAPGHGIVIRQVVDWDFINRHVETDYTAITFPVVYIVGPGWVSAGNLAMFKSFKKTGKTARLRVRAKRDAYVGIPVPIKSFNLVVCDEGTAVNVQTQLCTLTTSWVDYTLIADLSSLGDQLQWGIEVIPQSTNTAIAESTFKFYIDDIELAQWAL